MRVLLIFIIFTFGFCSDISISSSIDSPVYAKTIKIAAIHSYNIQHPCGRPQQIGFVDELVKRCPRVKWHIENYYMQTKTVNITVSKIHQQALYAIKFVKDEVKPNFVFITDDNAFRYVGSILSRNYKVFFSGLNESFATYRNVCNTSNVAGVMEIVKISKMFKILSYDVFDNIYILIDQEMSLTTKGLLNTFVQSLRQHNWKYKMIRFENTNELKKWLKEKNNERSLLIIILQKLYDFSSRKYVDKLKICSLITRYNKSNLEWVFNPQFVKLSNIALAEGLSFYEMGRLAADLLIESVKTGRFQHKIVYPNPLLVCNYSRLKQLGYSDIYELNSAKFDHVY
jgi:hypothetical protein